MYADSSWPFVHIAYIRILQTQVTYESESIYKGCLSVVDLDSRSGTQNLAISCVINAVENIFFGGQ